MLATLTVLALAAPATAAAVRRWRRPALFAAALVPLGAFVWVLVAAPTVLAGGSLTASYRWAPELHVNIDLRLDALTLVVLLLITGVGAAVLAYSAAYFEADDPSLARSSGVLVAFAAAMFGLVVADNLLLLYVFWELTTVCSFLLIGHDDEDPESVRSARHALLVTTGFGLVMLLGFVLLGEQAGTYQISRIVAEPPTGATTTVAALLILLGALAKSAQVPLHGWLPDAMVAPTPVSAYLHAAAMVKAGIYLVARLAPAFEGIIWWRTIAVLAGLASLLYGGWQALRQIDIKRLLAYGTISQLGLLMILAGAGTRTAALALVAMLLAHGLFKSALFLLGGVVEHEFGTRRIGEIPDVLRGMPVAAGAALLAGASMVGLPPLLGFVGKEASLAAFEHATPADIAILSGVAVGSAFTVAYTIHLLRGGFGPGDRSASEPHWPWGLLAAPAALSLGGLVGGLGVGWVHRLAEPYAASLPAVGRYTLTLWHGFTPTLAITTGVLVVGALAYVMRGRLAPGMDPGRPTETAYRLLLTGTHHTARVVTARIQAGSLPAYLVVIIAVALLLPEGGYLAGSLRGADGPRLSQRLWDNTAQAVLAAIALACALGILRARSRLPAVLLLTGVGFAVTGLFYVHGATDLALTLLLVESLTLIALVLVLRRLPANFPEIGRRPARRTILTASLASVAGAWIAVLLWLAGTARQRPAASAGYVEKAETAGGTNLVNLILVDFRALDTLFEITVLLVAALGLVNLIAPFLARRRARDGPRRRASGAHWRRTIAEPQLATIGEPPLGRRSVTLEAAVRVLVPTILVFSVYLVVAGHNAPGGGFVGGLVAGLAYVLRYVAGGSRELRAAWPGPPIAMIGVGLALAATVGLAGLPIGGSLLHSASLTATLPLIGEVKLNSNLVFDVGVYLLVLGLTHTVLATLGSGIDEGGRGRSSDAIRGGSGGRREAAP